MITKRISAAAHTLANYIKLSVPRDWGKSYQSPVLSQVIDWVRQRWRLRLLISGLVWILGIGTIVLSLFAWLLDHWHFVEPAVWWFRIFTVFSLGCLLFYYFFRPLNRPVSNANVALYMEEHEPSLKSIILGAVDATNAEDKVQSPQLVAQLRAKALDACRSVNYGQGVEVKQLQRAGLKLGLMLLFVLGLFVSPPHFLRSGAPVLLMPWTKAAEFSPYRVELTPGNIEAARGNDQLVNAKVVGFEPERAILFVSEDSGDSWQQKVMNLGGDVGLYESYLFNMNNNLDYYVEADGLQSEVFHIDVADIPEILKISLKYHYPAYTLLEPKYVEDSGDISALRGTRVRVTIQPTISIPGGSLVINDGPKIDLVRSDAGTWSANLLVSNSTDYKVVLQRASGKSVDAGPEYRIEALDDKHPTISIVKPGRDIKVSMIEEAITKVRASDDQGIEKLELVYSVNGEAEQKIGLLQSANTYAANNKVDAQHTLYLENMNLRPGDLISYYARAVDRGQSTDARSVSSDMFFFQVRNFRTDYHRSGQRGGSGSGSQRGQQGGFLSEQQKRFVVAAFKVIRDRVKYSENRYTENLDILAKAQTRIRNRVEAIINRIGTRAVMQMDERYKIIAEELPLAAKAMVEVESKLKQSKLDKALPDAQIALKHLQRADTAFRDVSVSMSNRGGARGGAGATSADDLANLFKLEMDKLSHQYESVQRGRQQSSAKNIDEALDRLRELARRQQQEIERRRQSQDQQIDTGSNKNELSLAKKVEEMVRRLERLTRTQSNPRLQQSIDQLKSAAAAMRRAATGSNTGGMADANRAAENLREAQRLLDQSKLQQFSQDLEKAFKLAQETKEKQGAIKKQVVELDNEESSRRDSQLKQINRHKDEFSAQLANLNREINSLMIAARKEQPEAIQSIKKAAKSDREYRLQERIRRSKEMLLLNQKKHAIDNEIQIQAGLEKMKQHLESALASVTEHKDKGLARSLERMRALTREFQFIRERVANFSSARSLRPGGETKPQSHESQSTQQELQKVVSQAIQLGKRLLNQGVSSGNIDPVLTVLQDLSKRKADLVSKEAQEIQDRTLTELKELEYKLTKKLRNKNAKELSITQSRDIPDDYKKMVSDYYLELSRRVLVIQSLNSVFSRSK
ncbi:hypothetical protein ACFL17_00790 [Pseudomonadota bacterium]